MSKIVKSSRMILRKNSAGSEFRRRRLNFIEGSNITLTVNDDSTDNEVDLTIAGAAGLYNLKSSAEITGSAASIITCSSLDLDTDKAYKILAYVISPTNVSPFVQWQANADTTAGNYRYQRLEASGIVATATQTSAIWGAALPSSPTEPHGTLFEVYISKTSGGQPVGHTSVIPTGTIGTIAFRQFSFAWNSTANLTSFSLTEASTQLGVGTKLKVYSMGL